MTLPRLMNFIRERELVRRRKEAGEPPPWTDDPILREYRFCNVRREDDRVTRWIVEHISKPFADHEHLWFMLCVARTINWPDTLETLMNGTVAWPDSPRFAPDRMTLLLENRKAHGDKVYTGAYMIRAESDPAKPWYSWTKQRYIAEVVLGELWEDRGAFNRAFAYRQQTIQGTWETLQQYTGWGPFMAYQAVVDMRWTRYLCDAPDINTWAALGPGSRRGLNRLAGRPVGHPLRQEEGLAEMLEIRALINQPGALAPWVPTPLDLSDVQGCLCETDKHLRVTNGEGRPRARYVPGRGS